VSNDRSDDPRKAMMPVAGARRCTLLVDDEDGTRFALERWLS
jgi:hypothetical protein